MRALIEAGANWNRPERHVVDQGDVEVLLDQLDGRAGATVSFGLSHTSEEVELILGITPDGYLLTRSRDGDFEQLIGKPGAQGEIELVLGGQPTPTPRRWLTGRAEVVRILGRYVQGSTFPEDLLWEQP
ncbi:MAG TPA: hypothetical protein VK453_19820 [Micromonosporaceae bacterium]|nr:hypothetical protein [Micromonosporaceae bacterium]